MTRDIGDSFLNESEFAERHVVASKSILCVLYEELGTPADEEQVAEIRWVLHARTTDLPSPRVGERLIVDGHTYSIDSARADYGMTELKLSQFA